MRRRRLKVFHGLVNYGTQAGLFARSLRDEGIDAISVSYPDAYKRVVDIELLHGGKFLLKVIRHTWNWARRFYWFFKYNTFHFYFGTTLFSKQKDLQFYRLFGKKVIMEYMGYDIQLYEYSVAKYEVTNVRFYKSKEISLLADVKKQLRYNSEIKYVDKQFVCAPYLSEFAPNSTVLPLAIDLNLYQYVPKKTNENEVVIMHAPTSRDNKGTSFILNAVNQLLREGYPIRLLLPENVSHQQLKHLYVECDIFIDQILAGWYGTATIEAMAIGRPSICFIRESYFKYINYGSEIPIINAEPSTIYKVLKATIDQKQDLPFIGLQSRAFVEKVHDLKKVTRLLIDEYQKL